MSTTHGSRTPSTVTAVFAAYLGIVLLGTLYPYTFEIPRYLRERATPAPAWDDTDGMVFDGIGLFWEGTPRADIADAVMAAGAFYVYVEAMPTREKQYGPSRIVAYSRSRDYQAFILGQWGRDLAIRIRRVPEAPRERNTAQWRVPGALDPNAWNAILLVADSVAVRVYRNGTLLETLPGVRILAGTWRRDCYLIAGNEATGDRGWYGRLRRVEVGAGAPPARIWAEAGVTPAPAGDAATDATTPPLLDLAAAEARRPDGWASQKRDVANRGLARPWTLIPFRNITQIRNPWIDWVLNVGLFAPFGWLLRRRGLSLSVVVACACATSLLIEFGQVFLPTRTCDTTDVLLNTAGALVGALLVMRRTPGPDMAG